VPRRCDYVILDDSTTIPSSLSSAPPLAPSDSIRGFWYLCRPHRRYAVRHTVAVRQLTFYNVGGSVEPTPFRSRGLPPPYTGKGLIIGGKLPSYVRPSVHGSMLLLLHRIYAKTYTYMLRRRNLCIRPSVPMLFPNLRFFAYSNLGRLSI